MLNLNSNPECSTCRDTKILYVSALGSFIKCPTCMKAGRLKPQNTIEQLEEDLADMRKRYEDLLAASTKDHQDLLKEIDRLNEEVLAQKGLNQMKSPARTPVAATETVSMGTTFLTVICNDGYVAEYNGQRKTWEALPPVPGTLTDLLHEKRSG